MLKKKDLVIELDHISKHDEVEVGEEAASFGEIAKLGIPIPKGFVITANAYHLLLRENNLPVKEKHLFISTAKHSLSVCEMPKSLIKEIFRAYKKLDNPLKDANVIVGSSFSKKKYKNVKGEANLVQKIRSLWSIYLDDQGIDYPNFEPAIFVYRMPTPANSGIMFTIDQRYNDKTALVIKDDSDNYYEVSKAELKIVGKTINRGKKQILSDSQIINLAKWGKNLQEYYYFPQEVHFSVDQGRIYITKTKPLTSSGAEYLTDNWTQVLARSSSPQQSPIPKKKLRAIRLLVKGISIYPGIATGYLRIISQANDLHKLKGSDVAVITSTKNLKLRDVGKKASAIVIESRYHQLRHHPFPRTLGKPMIATIPNSSRGLKEGIVVTVNAVSGEVYI